MTLPYRRIVSRKLQITCLAYLEKCKFKVREYHTYTGRGCAVLSVGCWDADRIISFRVLVCTFVFFNNIIQWYFSTSRMTDFLPNFSKLYISAFSILLCFKNVPISWLDPLISATVERWMEFLRVGEKCNSISEEMRWDSTSAVKRSIGEVVQSWRRPLLGPSPGWKRLLALSH